MKPRRITLALGGGGARGVAHLGAIDALLAAGLEIERLVGVSSGSLVAAMFAFEPDIEKVLEQVGNFLHSPEFARHQSLLLRVHPAPNVQGDHGMLSSYHRVADFLRANRMLYRAVHQSSLIPGLLLEEVVNHLLPDADLADASIPLSIVAVDLHTGRPVVFEKGSVRLAVKASAAVPGVFPPIEFENQLLCDIGGFCALPLGIARAYHPECLIAVDVGSNLKPLVQSPTALEVMMRMNDIGSAMFREQLRTQADLTIVPDVADVPWFDFSTSANMIDAGRDAATAALAKLPPQRSWFQRLVTGAISRLINLNRQENRHLPRTAAAFHL